MECVAALRLADLSQLTSTFAAASGALRALGSAAGVGSLALALYGLGGCASTECPRGDNEDSVFCRSQGRGSGQDAPPPGGGNDNGGNGGGSDDNGSRDPNDGNGSRPPADDDGSTPPDGGDGMTPPGNGNGNGGPNGALCNFPGAGWGYADTNLRDLAWQVRYSLYRDRSTPDRLLVRVQGTSMEDATGAWGAYRLGTNGNGTWRFSQELNRDNDCVDASPPSLAVTHLGNGVYDLTHTNTYNGRPVTIHPTVIRVTCAPPNNLPGATLNEINVCRR